MTSPFCPAVFADGPKRVIILHSFGPDFKPWNEYGKAIRAELTRQAHWPLNIFEHSLDIARSSDENPEAPFVDYLRALYAKQRIDLIVSIGAPAAAFVHRHRQHLFPTTPMLFTVVDQRRVRYSTLTSNDAVVAVAIDYRAAIENIFRVLPDTKNLMIVVGTSPIEKFWKEAIAKDADLPVKNRAKLIWTDDVSFDETLKRAAVLPPNSAIFWELMIVDAAGVVHDEGKALARLHAVANAPIFSYTDAFFGREIVGGPHVPVLEHGHAVAEAAMRILRGESPGSIVTPPTGMGTPKFDWRELQRWGIKESRLPPGSEIYFRSPTAWELYRLQILAFCTTIAILAGLVLWLLHERWRRHQSEAVVRQTMSELAHINRVATAGELSASIAHEVTQPLTGIVATANAALRWLSAGTPDVAKAQAALKQIVDAGHRTADVVRSVRAIFKNDTPERREVNLNDLILKVLALIKAELDKHDIRTETYLDRALPPVMADPIQLQQVLMNLIMNAIEAMTSVTPPQRLLSVRTGLTMGEDVLLSIEDNGKGISADDADQMFKPMFTTKTSGMGMGLAICKTIIEAHQGRIWAEQRHGHGAVLRLSLPAGNRGG